MHSGSRDGIGIGPRCREKIERPAGSWHPMKAARMPRAQLESQWKTWPWGCGLRKDSTKVRLEGHGVWHGRVLHPDRGEVRQGVLALLCRLRVRRSPGLLALKHQG